jgi:putative tricarboxylic transport membrane protein
MRNRNFLSSVAAAILGAFVCIEGYLLEIGSLKDPGSGFIFFWLGFIIIALSSVIYFQSLASHSAADPKRFTGIQQLIAIILSLTLYAAAFESVGFVVSTLLVMLFLFKAMGSQSWKTAVIAAFLSSISAYLMFDVWLGCSLPVGILRIG